MRRPNSKFMDTSGAGFFSNPLHLKLLDPIESHRPSESSTSHSIFLSAFPVLWCRHSVFGVCICHLKPRLIQFFIISLHIFLFHPSFITYSSHGLPSHVLSSMFIMAPTACVRSCPPYPLQLMSKSLRLIDHRETFVSSENKFTRTRFHLSITVKTNLTHPTFCRALT